MILQYTSPDIDIRPAVSPDGPVEYDEPEDSVGQSGPCRPRPGSWSQCDWSEGMCQEKNPKLSFCKIHLSVQLCLL